MSKMQNNNITPEGWTEVKLSEIGEVVSGGTPDTKVSSYWNGNIAWCTPTDITALEGKKFITHTSKTITEEGLKNSAAVLLNPGSLIICTRATIGDCAINKTPICTNQGFKNVIPNREIEVDFLYYLINHIKPTLLKLSSGSTFLEISKKAFSGIPISLPPKNEQQKIAEILSTVDEKIEVIEEKITKSQELKKGLMQHLFAKGIGHNKFKESSLGRIPQSWEVNELREMADVKRGLASQHLEYVENSLEGVRLIRINDFKNDDPKFIKETKETQKLTLELHDILMAGTGATAGITFLVKEDWHGLPFSYNAPRIRSKAIEDAEFIYYFLNSEMILGQQQSMFTGNAQHFLDTRAIGNLKILVPPTMEKRQIVEILSTTDEKIKTLELKKEAYGIMKAGLMQQLLTGKTRVINLLQKEATA